MWLIGDTSIGERCQVITHVAHKGYFNGERCQVITQVADRG